MSHPADSGPKAPTAFTGGARLSPDDCERLASMFRPSWELDDAPFTGAGSLSEEELRMLQGGGGIHADVRATAAQSYAQATNRSHAPPAATQFTKPESSVVVDPDATHLNPVLAPMAPPEKLGSTVMGLAAPPIPQSVRPPASVPPQSSSAAPIKTPAPSQRPLAPQFQVGPPAAPKPKRTVSADVLEAYSKKKPKTGLFVGGGVAAAAVVALVAWMASSSGADEKSAGPAATDTHTAEDKLSSIPPPPPVVTPHATAATIVPTPPPATTVAAAAPAPIPTTAVTALPQAPPLLPAHAAAASPRPNYAATAPSPRPAGKQKSGQTIVRDVPF